MVTISTSDQINFDEIVNLCFASSNSFAFVYVYTFLNSIFFFSTYHAKRGKYNMQILYNKLNCVSTTLDQKYE